MKRALVLVEGQTEERFVKDILRQHLWAAQVDLAPTIIATKRVKHGSDFRGGVVSYGQFERDVRRLLAGAGPTLVTTMVDYYGLPADFPGMASRPVGGPYERVRHVEAAIREDIGNQPRFRPFLTLHEFEALLFSSPSDLAGTLARAEIEAELRAVRDAVTSPEEINERPGQSPAQRIQALAPEYRKTLHGPTVAGRIGLDGIRTACPHFGEFVEFLESWGRT